jgi:hypothetical protein
MKLIAPIFISPILTEGTFTNVAIIDYKYELAREEKYFRIDFKMYLEDKPEVILETAYLAFQGMDADAVNSNRKATFKFNDDSDDKEPRGLLEYIAQNQAYPTNYTMTDWGKPTFEQVLNYLTGGTLQSPEIQPVNQFVKDWILNSIIMKTELIGVQFKFVD